MVHPDSTAISGVHTTTAIMPNRNLQFRVTIT